ncbi:MAG: twitching motility protein PilT [Candidatus Methanomethylophilaceae archaeon]|nr:twitching motility protein PilT [Candidatus Methanomethylophilaceae archaeon]MDD3378726.1 twitching motility protein PilT [Candidatus Methanomethylophilaceae archaeon]MDY0224681.1 twitching motility protein PilT [Candidatus Methanomethylophilaceae archaeon]
MQTVVLDTNALLMPFELKLNLDIMVNNVLGDAHMVVPEPLLGELKRSKNKYAKVALALAKKYEAIPTKQYGDNAVIEVALKTGGIVLTNDRELRSRLRILGVSLLYLRSGTHLMLEEL